MRLVALVAACFATLIDVTSLPAFAAAPSVYTQPAYESPLRGDPDDLLLIPGYGLAANDVVVYQSVSDTTHLPAHPASVPTTSNATLGVADLVSSVDAPYSLAVHLPAAMTANQSYALWVRAPDGSWSAPIPLNDARPLWITPDSAYRTSALAGLPRVLKVVGRNLQPGPGAAAATQVRLVGSTTGTTYTLTGKNTANDSANTTAALERYVAEVSLPATLTADHYSIQVSRDGTSWVPLLGNGQSAAQTFTVNADPLAQTTYSVSDPQFADPVTGTCQPNDGIDDTYCIIMAIRKATLAGGGTVVFGPGVWTMTNPGTWVSGVSYSDRTGTGPGQCTAPTEMCGVSYFGVIVPLNVGLRGAGATGTGATTIERGTGWVNSTSSIAGFTLQGNNIVSGIAFTDKVDYTSGFGGSPELRLGLTWYFAHLYSSTDPVTVANVVITNNLFAHPYMAIGDGALPTDHVYITNNTFGGAWNTAIYLGGDGNDARNLGTSPAPVYPYQPYRFNDSVIAYNTFYPSSFQQTAATFDGGGPIATQINTSARLDFSHNLADGTSTQYLINPTDPKGWRAAHFWSTGINQEMMLVSSNTVSCPGDKYGDGESFAYDGSGVNGGMPDYQPVIAASAWTDPHGVAGTTVSVQGTIVTQIANSNGPVDISANPTPLYQGYWVQVLSGKGKGQWRKVVSVSTGSNSSGPTVTLNVTPAFDVLPDSSSKVVLDLAYWQQVTVNNSIDQRKPTCTKANTRGGGSGGTITWYASTADSALEGNQQYDTTGIMLHHAYYPPGQPLATGAHMGAALQSMNEIRGNSIQGAYNWANAGGGLGGVQLGYGAAQWLCANNTCPAAPPPDLGFGVVVARNIISQTDSRDADGSVHPPIGVIGLNANWSTGPAGPSPWQMADATLIFHNTLQNISASLSGNSSSLPNVGIGIDVAQGNTLNPPISWRSVLYANSCSVVDVPVSDFGTGTVRYCPTGAGSNCECTGTASADVGVTATSSSSVAAGSVATYKVLVTNHSTTTAVSGVKLIVDPPAGVQLNPGSYTTTLGSCDSSVNVCSLGSLVAGQTATVSVTANLTSLSSWPVTFSVTHRDADPVAGNDSVTLTEAVGAAGVWKFEEGSGTTTADASGSGNVGALVNGPTWTTGKTGGGLSFAAATSLVAVNGTGSLDDLYNSGHGMTVMAWIKPVSTGGGGGGRIVDKDNNDGGWFLKMNSATSVQFAGDQFGSAGSVQGKAVSLNSTNSIVLNQWQHVAVTWDGTSAAAGSTPTQGIHIYVNGTLADDTGAGSAINGAGVAQTDVGTPFTIGNRPVDKARNFNGAIDGVRVYNRILTQAEIQSLVNGGS